MFRREVAYYFRYYLCMEVVTLQLVGISGRRKELEVFVCSIYADNFEFIIILCNYVTLAATPLRRGITGASRLWLCIFNKIGK